MKVILIGTRNQRKFKEIKSILKKIPFRLVSLKGFKGLPRIAETGRSYQANALKKARLLRRWTGLPVLSEDSGLEVFALKGKPGIYSARYAGRDTHPARNNQKLLAELGDLPAARRQALYRCVAVFIGPDNNPLVSEGICQGRIAFAPRGKNGFGYDPLFIPAGYRRTFGELSARTKNRISHRARALRKIARKLSLHLI